MLGTALLGRHYVGSDGAAGGKKDMYKGWPFSFPVRASNGLAGLKGDLKGS